MKLVPFFDIFLGRVNVGGENCLEEYRSGGKMSGGANVRRVNVGGGGGKRRGGGIYPGLANVGTCMYVFTINTVLCNPSPAVSHHRVFAPPVRPSTPHHWD